MRQNGAIYGAFWANKGEFGAKWHFRQKLRQFAQKIETGGFKRHLDVEFGFFGPNWPGVGQTCRGGWGPFLGHGGLTMEIGQKSYRPKFLKFGLFGNFT